MDVVIIPNDLNDGHALELISDAVDDGEHTCNLFFGLARP